MRIEWRYADRVGDIGKVAKEMAKSIREFAALYSSLGVKLRAARDAYNASVGMWAGVESTAGLAAEAVGITLEGPQKIKLVFLPPSRGHIRTACRPPSPGACRPDEKGGEGMSELAYAEDGDAGLRAGSLDGRTAVLEGHLLRILDFDHLATLDAVRLYHILSVMYGLLKRWLWVCCMRLGSA